MSLVCATLNEGDAHSQRRGHRRGQAWVGWAVGVGWYVRLFLSSWHTVQSEKDTNEDIIKVFNLFDQDKKVAALRVATC